MRIRSALAVAASATLLLGAAGCSGDSTSSTPDRDPATVLTEAKDKLDTTEGVQLTLSTPEMAEGVSGITAADGVVTNAPAFDGTISVIFAGTGVEVPVIALDDIVYAQVPLTTGWSKIDPAEFGAPDPSGLLTGDSGFSSLLPATTDVETGKSVRGGSDNSEVLTTYSGTVPGEAMQQVIPSSSGDSFQARYQITDDSELRQAQFTGVFYPSSTEMTYVVDFEDYGVTQDITAPEVTQSGFPSPDASPEG